MTKPPTPKVPSIVTNQLNDDKLRDDKLKDEIDDSEYQKQWVNIMDQGHYQRPSTYERVEVLLLCWADNSDDMATKEEVNKLKSVFEYLFNYNAYIEYLDSSIEQRLQVQINAKVAAFVSAHDGPNTLFIVYYAGHGRPGTYYGSLELFGQSSPNDNLPSDKKKKVLDTIVWNQAEELLKPAEADVLELFDCEVATQGIWDSPEGNPGSCHGLFDDVYRLMTLRLFEYLAATREMAGTPVPGKDSFTSALIYALESLHAEQPKSRFTTVELRNKIKFDAPHFPDNQTPVLSNRKTDTSAGRIMLHPLRRGDARAQSPPKDAPDESKAKRHTLTLQFDFGEKPSSDNIERLGHGLNEVFAYNTLGVDRVRWGGLHSVVGRSFKVFIETLERNRRRRYGSSSSSNGAAPLTPALTNSFPTNEHSPQREDSISKEEQLPSPDSLKRALAPNEESDNEAQGRRKRSRHSSKRGRCAKHA